jgi:pimeloyl-ACP methyl ester carboxylesterase
MSEAIELSYSEHSGGDPLGRHPPLILIHGAGGTRLHWPPDLRRLDGERVYGLDLPGHGGSLGEGERTIEGYVGDVCSWMNVVGLDAGVFVGHSMGGAISLTMALEQPGSVAALILVGTGGRLRVLPTILEMTSKPENFGEVIDLIVSYAISPQAPSCMVELARARMSETRPKVLHGDFLACDRFDVMDRLGEISVPTLVICGVEDRLTPLKYSHFLTEHIPDARMVAIEGAGHMVMLEKAGEVTQAVKEFMDEVYG